MLDEERDSNSMTISFRTSGDSLIAQQTFIFPQSKISVNTVDVFQFALTANTNI
jgi:hypothetical protein